MRSLELMSEFSTLKLYPVRMVVANHPAVTFWVSEKVEFGGFPEVCYFDVENGLVALKEGWLEGLDPEADTCPLPFPLLPTTEGDVLAWAAMVLEPCYCSYIAVSD